MCVNCKERKGRSTLNGNCEWCFDNVFMVNVAKQMGWTQLLENKEKENAGLRYSYQLDEKGNKINEHWF